MKKKQKTFWIVRDQDDVKYRLHEAHTNEPHKSCQCIGYFSSNGYHASFSKDVMKMLGVKFLRPGEKAEFKLVRVK